MAGILVKLWGLTAFRYHIWPFAQLVPGDKGIVVMCDRTGDGNLRRNLEQRTFRRGPCPTPSISQECVSGDWSPFAELGPPQPTRRSGCAYVIVAGQRKPPRVGCAAVTPPAAAAPRWTIS